jgi:hypothetical protein
VTRLFFFGLAIMTAVIGVIVFNLDVGIKPNVKSTAITEKVVASQKQVISAAYKVLPIAKANVDQVNVGYKKPNDRAILVDVHELRRRNWLIGDILSVTIPHTGYVLETKIEEIRELAPGVTNVKSYPDAAMTNHVLITISRKNTFMNVFTPDGEYELTGGEEFGWLVPSRTLGGASLDDEYYGAAREFPEYQISTNDD